MCRFNFIILSFTGRIRPVQLKMKKYRWTRPVILDAPQLFWVIPIGCFFLLQCTITAVTADANFSFSLGHSHGLSLMGGNADHFNTFIWLGLLYKQQKRTKDWGGQTAWKSCSFNRYSFGTGNVFHKLWPGWVINLKEGDHPASGVLSRLLKSICRTLLSLNSYTDSLFFPYCTIKKTFLITRRSNCLTFPYVYLIVSL